MTVTARPTGDTQLQLRTCQAALTHLAEVVQPFPAADQYRAAAQAEQGVALVWTGQVDAGRAVPTAAWTPRGSRLDSPRWAAWAPWAWQRSSPVGSTKSTHGRRGVCSWPGDSAAPGVNQRRHLLPDRGPVQLLQGLPQDPAERKFCRNWTGSPPSRTPDRRHRPSRSPTGGNERAPVAAQHAQRHRDRRRTVRLGEHRQGPTSNPFYRKLDVRNRRSAIRLGHALALINRLIN